MAHGVQKLFGWFGGRGIDQTGATFDRLGFHPGKLNAIAAGLGEAAGGALLAVGLGAPGASAAVAGTMIVAASMHIERGFFNSKGVLSTRRSSGGAPPRSLSPALAACRSTMFCGTD